MGKASSNKEWDYIPQPIFETIMKCIPIVSVEALIVADNALLFLKRNKDPMKGEWWFPGGRVRKGESLEEALFREVKEETGLEITSCKFINVYSRVHTERHDITIAYLCRAKRRKVRLDDEHSEFGFFKRYPAGLHHFLIETIHDSKWKEDKTQNH